MTDAVRRIDDAPATRDRAAASPAERADLVAATYERIVGRGDEFASLHLTPSAHRVVPESP